MSNNFNINKSAMAKKVIERVRQYSTKIREYTRPTYNETEVRDKIWRPAGRQ